MFKSFNQHIKVFPEILIIHCSHSSTELKRKYLNLLSLQSIYNQNISIYLAKK